jgi:hypothetical protein
MIDGFHWTRVTSKQLRFLCEEFALPPSPLMSELACRIDRVLGTRANAPVSDAPRGDGGTDPADENAACCGAEPKLPRVR